MARYFPDAPAPWLETRDDIVDVVGRDAEVTEAERSSPPRPPVASLDAVERHSAPINPGSAEPR
jgi:hypothetical protein